MPAKAMHRSNRELWLAFLAIAGIGVLYFLAAFSLRRIPPAAELLGHGLGIAGFVLMLLTETLYSLRKRRRDARWGRMANWLEFHIFTGIVGPFMVLLHTSWKFNGLAGVVTLLMLIVVASGFVGRYIYTAVPRTLDGAVLEAEDLQQEIAALRAASERDAANVGDWARRLPPQPPLGWLGWLRWELAIWGLPAGLRPAARQLGELMARRRQLERQLAQIQIARRMLSIWHTVHIPIGMALFSTAFVHIVAAFYYATLLR